MKGGDDYEKVGRTSDFLEDLEEPAPADQVEGFGQVHKRDEQWLLLLSTLLLQLAKGEDHVHGGPAGSEAALRLGINALGEALEAVEDDSGKHLADDA